MPTAYGYGRESTQKQGESGLGREAQLDKIHKHAAGLEIPYGGDFFDSAVSGLVRMTERKAGGELDRTLRRGDIVIISRLDRAFRRTADALYMVERWHALGIKLHVCDFGGQFMDMMSGIGKFILTVLVAFAELERSYISERTRIALAQRVKRGLKKNGNKPGYGFKYVGKGKGQQRVPDDDQRELMRQIYEWHDELGMSLDHIRQHLQFTLKIPNRWGSKKNDGEWLISTLHNWISAERTRMSAIVEEEEAELVDA